MTQPGAQVYTQGFGTSNLDVAFPIYLDSAPTSTYGVGFPIGKRAIVESTNSEYVLTSKSTSGGVTSTTWTVAGSPTGAVATETGDTGTATPSSGNIKHAGTANEITTAASGATITYSLPAAITAPGSLTTTSTLTAGTELGVTGGAATDYIGQATLASGTVTVANTNIAATDRIFVTRSDLNSSSALGELVITITPATSFTITSVSIADGSTTITGDTSIVDYVIIAQV